MAVPKKKMSKSRTRRRKATHKVSKPHFMIDPETGVPSNKAIGFGVVSKVIDALPSQPFSSTPETV